VDITEIMWEGVDRIHLSEDRGHRWALVRTVMNLQVPGKEGNFLTS